MSVNPNTQKPSVTLSGNVEKIIKSPEKEKVQIAIKEADPLYREIRIENSLEDGNGKKVRLKEDAEVEVTVEADPQAVVPNVDSQKLTR